jgi:hypothetical protein
MGVVYKATDLSLGPPCGLEPDRAGAGRGRALSARFLNEPRLAASLDHPNVVPIYPQVITLPARLLP